MACIAVGKAGGADGTTGTAAVGCVRERKAKRKSLAPKKKHGVEMAEVSGNKGYTHNRLHGVGIFTYMTG